MRAKVEWSYWPQYRRYVLTCTTSRQLAEDLVEQVILSPSQARKFAKMVCSHEDDCNLVTGSDAGRVARAGAEA